MRRGPGPICVVLSIVVLAAAVLGPVRASSVADAAWPQFRGPAGAGVLDGAKLPLEWSPSSNVAWRADVPGRGWSSPVAWKDQVFVTSAISAGSFKAPSTGIFGNDFAAELTAQGLSPEEVMKRVSARDLESSDESGEVRYMVYAFDSATGRVRWEREAHKGAPFGGRHRKNTFASETPVTDGQRLYVYFGNVGLFCYALDGTPIWTTKFEPQPMYLNFGTASSPVVHDGRVFILHDNDGVSFVAAVDARTGKILWRVAGDMPVARGSGWSTPFVWTHAQRTELVLIRRQHAVAYSLDGKELWRLRGLVGQSTPSPVASDDMLYLSTGSQGESNRPVFAVRAGGTGDISPAAGETTNNWVAWSHPRASAYTSSPLVYRGRVYIVNDNGILLVLDAKTGAEIYKARVGGVGNTFSASPWAVDGKVFFLSEDGVTFGIEAGDKYVELAKNDLGEMSLATPALAPDAMFVRTMTKLYRIAGSQ
ncbi:MAG TPA: PQQ-binding-like beta-propeller repeat protein [Vicinamibacterales bacterium]|nr:PQQ-binding-like beta-propeller repeat protein [Vicinamibacterales bacterium]